LKEKNCRAGFFLSLKQRRPLALILKELQALSSVTGLLCFVFFERGKRSGRLFFLSLKQRRPLALILNELQALSSVTGLLCFMFFERKELSSRLFFKKSKTKEAIGAHFYKASSPLQRHWPPLFYVF